MSHCTFFSFLMRYGPFASHKFIILDQSLTIGRAEENSIGLTSLYVSRNHLKIHQHDADVWTIEDIGSFNGTYLANEANNEVVELEQNREYVLEEGYTVGIGVNPLMWKTRLEWVSDPEYFVYEFKRIPRISVQGHEMTDLCSMFQNSVQVTDDAEMMQSDGIF